MSEKAQRGQRKNASTEGLTVLERLRLSDILPKQTNIANLRLIMDVQRELGLSEKEIKEIGLVQKNGQISWKPTDLIKEIKVGEALRGIIVDGLNAMDKGKTLTLDHVSLWERFIEKKKPALRVVEEEPAGEPEAVEA